MTAPMQTALARKWVVKINTGTIAVPAWTEIKGRGEFKPNPHEATLQEDNAHDDGGWKSSTKTALSWGAELKLLRRTVAATGVYDVGQEKLRTLSRTFGAAGVAHIQYFDIDGGDEAYQGFCEVSWVPEGGAQDDLETVTVTLAGKGELAIIVNPNAGS